jgi:hypothetical protein
VAKNIELLPKKPPRIYFPWLMGDQEPKNTTHKYRVFEDQFLLDEL